MRYQIKQRVRVVLMSYPGIPHEDGTAERKPYHLWDKYYCISFKNKKFPCMQRADGTWTALLSSPLWNVINGTKACREHNELIFLRLENYLLRLALKENNIADGLAAFREPFQPIENYEVRW